MIQTLNSISEIRQSTLIKTERSDRQHVLPISLTTLDHTLHVIGVLRNLYQAPPYVILETIQNKTIVVSRLRLSTTPETLKVVKMLDCTIKQRTWIVASPEKVYDTFTNAADWDRFFTTGMKLDPSPGGICSFAWKDWGPDKYTLQVPGTVIEAERPNLFVFSWGEGELTTTITVRFEPADNGTTVTLTEDGYPNTSKGRAAILDCASGWGEALTLLKFYIEHGIVYDSALRRS